MFFVVVLRTDLHLKYMTTHDAHDVEDEDDDDVDVVDKIM